jgi:hypothetical protein
MKFGVRAKFFKELLSAYREGKWGDEGIATLNTMRNTAGESNKVKDIIRSMPEEKLKGFIQVNPIDNPYNFTGMSDADKLNNAFYNAYSGSVALPPFILEEPSVISHELRHVQQHTRPSVVKDILITESAPYAPFPKLPNITDSDYLIHDTSPNSTDPVGKFIGKKNAWKLAYRDYNINTREVDAMLSQHASLIKAGKIRGQSYAKDDTRPLIQKLWRNLPDFAKKHYMKTASLGGLGFFSEPKEQSEH